MAEKEVGYKITADTTQANSALSKLGQTVLTLNQGAELVSKGFNTLDRAIGTTIALINRGQAFTELSRAFDNLYGKAGTLAVDGIGKLQSATEGLISKVDLLKSANLAAASGLSPEQFLTLAKAADTLGDTVGKNTVEALNDLTASISAGNERALKHYGILVDNAKAEEAFAKSIGKTADQLNETGKREAFRIAALQQVEARLRNTAKAEDTAGDALQKLTAAINDSIDAGANFVNNAGPIIAALGYIAAEARKTADAFAAALGGGSKQGQMQLIDQAIGQLNSPGRRLFDQLTGDFNNTFIEDRLKVLRARYAQLAGEVDAENTKIAADSRAAALDELQNLDKIGQFLKDNTAEEKKRTDAITQQTAALKNQFAQLKLSELETGLDAAIKSLDSNTFQNALDNYGAALKQATIDGLTLSNAELAATPEGKKQIEELASAMSSDKMQAATDQFGDALRDQIQASADFFTDAFYNVFTGAAFDFGDMLKRFGAGVLGGIAGNLFPQFGNAGSLQGLGQSIGGQLLSEVFGMAGAGGTSGIGPVISGDDYAAMLGGGGGIAAALGSLAPVAALAAGGYGASSLFANISDNKKDVPGGIFSGGILGTLLGGPLGTLTGGSLGGLLGSFGGSTDPEKLARRDLRGLVDEMTKLNDHLEFNSFTAATQQITKLPYTFAGATPTEMEMGAFGLTTGLATSFAGESGTGADQLATIFSNALLTGATDFNDILANGLALLDQMGLSAEEVKENLKTAFLDGKVTLEDFGEGIQGLNLLAQENLAGKGSITDALELLAKSFGKPRNELKALELLFTEAKEIGITNLDQLGALISEQFGPEAASAFADIEEAGITSFENLSALSADQIFALISAFEPLKDNLQETFAVASEAEEAKEGFDNMTESIWEATDAVGALEERAKKALGALKELAGQESKTAQSNAAGTNPNPPNNPV